MYKTFKPERDNQIIALVNEKTKEGLALDFVVCQIVCKQFFLQPATVYKIIDRKVVEREAKKEFGKIEFE